MDLCHLPRRAAIEIYFQRLPTSAPGNPWGLFQPWDFPQFLGGIVWWKTINFPQLPKRCSNDAQMSRSMATGLHTAQTVEFQGRTSGARCCNEPRSTACMQDSLSCPLHTWGHEGRYGLVDKTHPSCVRPRFNTRPTLRGHTNHYATPAVQGMS